MTDRLGVILIANQATTETKHYPCMADVIIHCESKKLDHFSREHNFCIYCPILISLSLLQTEINCGQPASALPCKMNTNVLANVASMIS